MSGNGTWNTTILMVYNEMCNEISFDVFIIKLYTTLFDGVYKFIYFAKKRILENILSKGKVFCWFFSRWYITNISLLCGAMLYIFDFSVLIWPLMLKTKTETRSLPVTYNKPHVNMSVQLQAQKL